MKLDAESIRRIAKAVARRYKARCWWAELDDLVSEATVAVIKAQDTFDPQVGVPFEAYASKAAEYRVSGFLWRNSSPLSGGMHNPREHIAGVYSAPLSDDLVQDAPSAFDELALIETRLSIRRRIRALANRTPGGDKAVEVLLHGRAPKEIIKESGRGVYGAVHLVRRKVRSNARLFKHWRRGR